MNQRLHLMALLCLLLWAAPGSAQAPVTPGPVPQTYALLVGEDPGGEGQAPLRYAQADPAELASEALIEHAGSVLAELHKVAGSPLRLALPAITYNVVLGAGQRISECRIELRDEQVTRVVASACSALAASEARAKGYLPAATSQPRGPLEQWAFELSFGLGHFSHDDYTHRLNDFGFAEQILAGGTPLRWSLAVSRQLAPHLSVLGDLRNFDNAVYKRDLLSTASNQVSERFAWSSYALGLHVRAQADAFGAQLRFYAQLGGGLGYVHSKLVDHTEEHFGAQLAASAGLFYMPWRHFGFLGQLTYAYAPILSNQLGDGHDSGGVQLMLGLRYRTWSEP
ncbi:MAG TPA: hypothetical protein VF331_25690 [Polyangiales bacterium]